MTIPRPPSALPKLKLDGKPASTSSVWSACTSTSPQRGGEIALDGTVESCEYYGLYIKYYIHVGTPEPQGHREERRREHLRPGRDASPWSS